MNAVTSECGAIVSIRIQGNEVPRMITRFSAGTRLIHEGETSRRMFIIRGGKARVYKTYMGQRITLAILGEGEIFGELSFFDAEPRSASVEALTDLEVVLVENVNGTDEILGLAPWVVPVLRATFRRFREADQKITLLQGLTEYQKKVFKTDVTGKAIYLELLRFIKTLKIVFEAIGARPLTTVEDYQKEMDELLGSRVIGLKVFWKQLQDHGIVGQESTGLKIYSDKLDALNSYLNEEARSERYLLLSHTAVAILRRVVGYTNAEYQGQQAASPKIAVKIESLDLQSLPFYEESLRELERNKMLEFKDQSSFLVKPETVSRNYVYQDILKGFDHTTMSIE